MYKFNVAKFHLNFCLNFCTCKDFYSVDSNFNSFHKKAFGMLFTPCSHFLRHFLYETSWGKTKKKKANFSSFKKRLVLYRVENQFRENYFSRFSMHGENEYFYSNSVIMSLRLLVRYFTPGLLKMFIQLLNCCNT